MTTSEPDRDDGAFVWVWLPDEVEPVVAGRLQTSGTRTDAPVLSFAYGTSYLGRSNAIPLYAPELPLRRGTFDPTRPVSTAREPQSLTGCLRDAAPDAWGRRILNLRVGGSPEVDLGELTYLLNSGTDRIGALDFQRSATTYVPRGGEATLEDLIRVVEITEAGQQIPDDLAAAVGHGTSIGGARPKALLEDGSRKLIAKFSSATDDRPVVKAEGVAMTLARKVGINVPEVQVIEVAGKDVLLVERFDRGPAGSRRAMVSALTILGLGEMSSRYASYPMLADAIRTSFREPAAALRELYLRLVFNVCVGNNDDHLRNHAAFWDGTALALTPAYDLAPQPRNTAVSSQAIGLVDSGARASQLWLCRAAGAAFHLTPGEAEGVIDHVVTTIRTDWDEAADAALLTAAERQTLMGREILNDYIFYEEP